MTTTMAFIQGVPFVLLMGSGCLVYGASLHLLGDFDAQVEHLLHNEMLSPEEVHEIRLQSEELQDTLRSRWNGADLYAYGSLPTGLGTKSSDVDFYLRIPSYNITSDAYIVEETAKILNQRPEKYSEVILKLDAKVPMLTYYDLLMHRYIDLSFRSTGGLENTKLMKYYLNLDDRYLPLAAIIKFWCKVHQLTGNGILPNYSIYLIIVFYLQQKNMAPPVHEIQANFPPRHVNGWNTNLKEIPYSVENNDTLYELLGDFFKFYDDFNFAEYCVSPYAGRPVARRHFKDVGNVPEEFSAYIENVNAGDYDPLLVEAEICIQDVFEHNKNVARRVDRINASKFLKLLKRSVKYYDDLSSDRFLRSLLMKNKRK